MSDALLIVFGAGASYDSASYRVPSISGPRYRLRPPLAAELFADRDEFGAAVEEFSQARSLIARLRVLTNDRPLERELDRIQQEAESYPPYKIELTAIRFYLQMILWDCVASWWSECHGVTNYHWLLRLIDVARSRHGGEILLVTFNYDTLLERAASETLGWSLASIDSYIERGPYSLIKPHGSVNWARELDGFHLGTGSMHARKVREKLIEGAASLQISQRYRVISSRDEVRNEDTAFYPAIAIPIEQKRDFEVPPAHLDHLREALPRVTKAITIGWRATEQSFLALWRDAKGSSLPKTLVVSGTPDGAKETASRLRGAGVTLDAELCVNGFSNALVLGELEKFLQS